MNENHEYEGHDQYNDPDQNNMHYEGNNQQDNIFQQNAISQVQQQQQFNEDDPDFQDVSQSVDELQQYDTDKKDMKNRNPLGFERKFQTLQDKKKDLLTSTTHNPTGTIQNFKQGYFSGLNEKANLISPTKNIANYNSKTEFQFRVDGGSLIPFINYSLQTGRWEFSEYAIDAISQIKGPVSFVSIIGLPQTGKSTLMNLLLNNEDDHPEYIERFRSEMDASTKGLMMWSEPTFIPQTGAYVFFVDTQEFETQSDHGRQDREKIQFILTSLLSSVVLVNTQGALQDYSLLPCADLFNLNDYVEMEVSESRDEMKNFNPKEQIAAIFPKLIYIFRDFKDVMKDKGKSISWHQYLEHFLLDEEAFAKGSPEEKKIRRRIIKYFRSRDAHSFVAPFKQMKDHKPEFLNSQFNDLDPIFQEEIKVLRKKIIQHLQKKEFWGVFFSNTMMLSFINSLLEDINDQKKIDLIKAFEILIENEFICVYNDSIDIYNNYLADKFSDDNFKSFQELHQVLRQAREMAQDNFYTLKAHDTPFAQKYFEEYMEKLRYMINEKEQKLVQCNSEEQVRLVDAYADEKLEEVKKLTQNGQFSINDVNIIIQNYEKMMQTVMGQCMGATKDEPVGMITGKIMNDMATLFLREIQEIKDKSDVNTITLKKELERQVREKDNEIKTKTQDHEQKQLQAKNHIEKTNGEKKQIEQKLQAESQKNKELEGQKKELEQELQRTKAELEEQKKKGCCTIF